MASLLDGLLPAENHSNVTASFYKRRKSILYYIGFVLAFAGLVYYLAATVAWITLAAGSLEASTPEHPVDWWWYRHAIAAPLLACLLACALLLRKRTKAFTSLIVIALVLMGAWSMHDRYYWNFQLLIPPKGEKYKSGVYLSCNMDRFYLNWPWLWYVEKYLPHP